MVIPRQSSRQEPDYYDEDETMDDTQKVSLFTVRDYEPSGRYRLATGILGLLCAALLIAVIGMAVIIKDTGEGHISLSLNATGLSKELELLRAEHGRLVAAKNSLQQDYNQARGDRSILQAQMNREKAQQDRMLSQIKTLEEQQKEQALRVSQLELSCNRCPPEWEVEKDTCYYFPAPARVQRKGWIDAKADCITRGAQLVVIDTLEKQKFIAGVVRTRHSEGLNYRSGYWIGLLEQEEGWQWITGSLMTSGYWMPGEPNDYGSAEDCAATYPKVDPLQTWNDAPCSYPLMWICEKKATSSAGSTVASVVQK